MFIEQQNCLNGVAVFNAQGTYQGGIKLRNPLINFGISLKRGGL
jgi:hypothetical protein